MPVEMSPEVRESVAQTMKAAFKDLQFYSKVIEPCIPQIISDALAAEVDQRLHKRLTEKYYDVSKYKTEQEKLILTQIHIAVRACYVLVLSLQVERAHLLWTNVSQLLEVYPEFEVEDEQEQEYLLRFRNMMVLALMIVPPRFNKKLLINISARLEGSGKEYITGGGQKPCVTRRVLIYEREGNVQAEKREERPRHKDPENLTGRKRPQLNTSFKRLKLIRIASEEARRLVRLPNGTLSRQGSYSASAFAGNSGGYGGNGNFGARFPASSVIGVPYPLSAQSTMIFDELMGIGPGPSPHKPSYGAAPPGFGAMRSDSSTSSYGRQNSAQLFDEFMGLSQPSTAPPGFGTPLRTPSGSMGPPGFGAPLRTPSGSMGPPTAPPTSYAVPSYQGYGGTLPMSSSSMMMPPPHPLQPSSSQEAAALALLPDGDVGLPPMDDNNVDNWFPPGFFDRQQSEWITDILARSVTTSQPLFEGGEGDTQKDDGDIADGAAALPAAVADQRPGLGLRETSIAFAQNLPNASSLGAREISLSVFDDIAFPAFPMLRMVSSDVMMPGFLEDLSRVTAD